MPYQAERDATIPKVIGTTRNAENEKVAHYESVTYSEGAVVFEEDIAPHILRRLEEGDDHISSLLRYVDEAEARKILKEQSQDSASQSTDEGDILHQEERLGSSPSIDPEVEVANEPPYEAPPAGGSSGDGEQVNTEDQTVGQGTGGTEDESEAEERPQGASESDGSSDDESSDQASDTKSEDSGNGDTSDETKEAGQGQADDSQEKSDGDDESNQSKDDGDTASEDEGVKSDEFSEMSKADLLKAAKAKKISGRTKMNEDQLREALRAE